MEFSSLSKTGNTTSSTTWSSSPPPFPLNSSLTLPKLKTMHGNLKHDHQYSTDLCFTSSSSSSSSDEELYVFPTISSQNGSMDVVVRGLMPSDRLFFEPSTRSSSIMEEFKAKDKNLLKQRWFVLEVESEDPREDFRVSMREMVAEHGLGDWERLHELLEWYLEVNEKKRHGLIVETYVNLLLELMSSS